MPSPMIITGILPNDEEIERDRLIMKIINFLFQTRLGLFICFTIAVIVISIHFWLKASSIN